MTKPVVSIIIATFNAGQTLRVALDSVLEQSFKDWECLVIDGASRDDTVHIIEEYENKDARFRHISEPDHGIYDAFNKGWRLAQGEWIHYLGSDDRLTKDSFVALIAAADEQSDVLYGNCYIIHVDGSISINKQKGTKGCHQAKITRRSAIEQMGGFDESFRIVADADLIFRQIRQGMTFKYVDTNVAYFSMDGTSQKLSTLLKRSHEIYRLYSNYVPCPRYHFIVFFLHSLASLVKRQLTKRFFL